MQNRIYVYTCIYVYTRVYVHVCIVYIYMYIIYIYIVNILIMKSIRGRFSLKPKPRITNCLSLTQFGADTTKIWCCHIGLTHTLRCSCQDLAPQSSELFNFKIQMIPLDFDISRSIHPQACQRHPNTDGTNIVEPRPFKQEVTGCWLLTIRFVVSSRIEK